MVAEGRGSTIDEAVADALAQLGLTRDAVTVEVLSENRRGLFGSGKRAHVRVTANTADTADTVSTEPSRHEAREKEDGVAQSESTVPDQESLPEGTDPEGTDRPERTTRDPEGNEEVPFEELSAEERTELLDREADHAADFVEGLLDLLDLPGDIEIEIHEEQALVTIQDVGSGLLIGRRGATLDALQELVRGAVQRQTERRTHVRVDVEGYRSRQLEKLRDKCREAIAEVRETGKAVRLEPMDPFERKMMHDLVAKTGGVSSSSEGSEPRRRVVIHPA